MNVERPIFIIGSGRSGTTILYKLISVHPQVCWFSNYSNKFPSINILPIWHKILDLPLVGKYLKNKILNKRKYEGKLRIKPSEGGNIYHRFCKFTHKEKRLGKYYNNKKAEKFKWVIYNHLKYTGKKRFISKQTANTQRLFLLDKIFSNPIYIHIYRKGEAVANSLNNVAWWPKTHIWWLGTTVEKYIKNEDISSLELAARHHRKNCNEIQKFKNHTKNSFMEVSYSELCENTIYTVKKIVNYCKLDWKKSYKNMLPKSLSNSNYKWKENLSKNKKLLLKRIYKSGEKLER